MAPFLCHLCTAKVDLKHAILVYYNYILASTVKKKIPVGLSQRFTCAPYKASTKTETQILLASTLNTIQRHRPQAHPFKVQRIFDV